MPFKQFGVVQTKSELLVSETENVEKDMKSMENEEARSWDKADFEKEDKTLHYARALGFMAVRHN